MKLGRFVMKWSFQGVGPEILAQDVCKNPRVVLQDLNTTRGFLRTSRAKMEVQPRE